MFNKSNVLFSEDERTHQTRKAEELQIRNKKKGLYKKKVYWVLPQLSRDPYGKVANKTAKLIENWHGGKHKLLKLFNTKCI